MTSSPTTVIIADDLTGACDTGVQLATARDPCPVLLADRPGRLSAPRLATLLERRGRLVVDTESRHSSAADAGERVRAAARAAGAASVVFKKIDSTLRGNIVVETRALREVFPRRIVVVAPAFPAAGRTTAGGICLVDGIPVHETGFARHPRSPVRTSRIADLVDGGDRALNASADRLGRVVEEAAPGTVIIVDACSDEELSEVARIVGLQPGRYLPVGTAGLARAMGSVLGAGAVGAENDGRRPSDRRFVEAGRERPVLGLVGSLNERSRRQARFVRDGGVAVEIVLDARNARATARAAVTRLRAGRDVLVISPSEATRDDDASRRLALAFGAVARAALRGVEGLALFLTGGDTALAAMGALRVRELEVYRELAPGVPIVGLLAERARNGAIAVPAVTKAGGFGDDDAIARAFARLKEER